MPKMGCRTAVVWVSLLSVACCALQQAPAGAAAPAHLSPGHRKVQQQQQQQQQGLSQRQLLDLDVHGCEGSWAAAPGGIAAAAAAAATAGIAGGPAGTLDNRAAAGPAEPEVGYMQLGRLVSVREARRRHNARPSTTTSSSNAVISEASISSDAAVAALGPSTPADAAASQAAVATDVTSGSSVVQPASVCSGDPPLKQTNPSRTLCRLFINSLESDTTFQCSAWFVTPRHMVTAGHCVSMLDGDSGMYDMDPDNPGYVCCQFLPPWPGSDPSKKHLCRRAHTWNVTKWVTTAGYFKFGYSANDGAVIEVVPAEWRPNRTVSVPPVPQRLMAFNPLRPIPKHRAYLDGYPSRAVYDSGCAQLNSTQRHYTEALVEPSIGTGILGLPAEYPLSGCVGQSGGRVVRGGPGGFAYGIQTYGSTICELNGKRKLRGMTGVTQISMNATQCGVCVACLVEALEKFDGSSSSSNDGSKAG